MDYNIYLHSDESLNKATQPKSMGNYTKPKQIKDQKNNASQTIKKVGSFVSNPDSVAFLAKGAAIAKLGIIGIALKVVYDVGMRIATEYTDLVAVKTGDVSGQRNLGNIKNAVGAVFTPVSSGISYYKYTVERQKQTERAYLQQELLGDSVLNQNYARKV